MKKLLLALAVCALLTGCGVQKPWYVYVINCKTGNVMYRAVSNSGNSFNSGINLSGDRVHIFGDNNRDYYLRPFDKLIISNKRLPKYE